MSYSAMIVLFATLLGGPSSYEYRTRAIVTPDADAEVVFLVVRKCLQDPESLRSRWVESAGEWRRVYNLVPCVEVYWTPEEAQAARSTLADDRLTEGVYARERGRLFPAQHPSHDNRWIGVFWAELDESHRLPDRIEEELPELVEPTQVYQLELPEALTKKSVARKK